MMDARDSETKQASSGSSLRGTCAGAYILQIAALALIGGGIVRLLPFWEILLTGTFWLAFSSYWGIAA